MVVELQQNDILTLASSCVSTRPKEEVARLGKVLFPCCHAAVALPFIGVSCFGGPPATLTPSGIEHRHPISSRHNLTPYEDIIEWPHPPLLQLAKPPLNKGQPFSNARTT
jgi:hypothetical protein